MRMNNAMISFVFLSNDIYNSKNLHSDQQGEKLLNNLGGMFSKPWKPKKTREIQGPIITPGFLLTLHLYNSTFWSFSFIDQATNNTIIVSGAWTDKPSKKNVHNKEDREKLGLAPLPKGRSAPTTPPNESSDAYQKVDVSAFLLCLSLCIGFSSNIFIVLFHWCY